MSRFTVIAAATAAALGTLSIALPAGASVLTPPTPVTISPGCGGTDTSLVLVYRKRISQDQDCAARPVMPVGSRHGNLDECASGPVVTVGTRHGNVEDCAAAPMVPVGKRLAG